MSVAPCINNCLLPRLNEIVKFKDPTGNVHKVAVKAHNRRQWFEDGMVEMMQI
ncbi:hydantoinase/oxoprolinase family protein [Sesbania bispinosa]|nr:hydantoinase/oxoprolinase family protein [Sesbania bispinosa]